MTCDPFGLLKILSAFLLCSAIGWFLFKPDSKIPALILVQSAPRPRALILVTYNDNAEPVPAFVTWGNQTHQPTNTNTCKLEHLPDEEYAISLEPEDTKRYGPKRSLSLRWLSQKAYSQWLHKDFPEILKKRHASMTKWQPIIARFDVQSGDATFVYPVLIEAK